jgi:hypothetical protein
VPLLDGRDDLVAVDRVDHCLAHLGVLEERLGQVELQVGRQTGVDIGQHGQVRHLLHALDVAHRHAAALVRHDVDFASRQRVHDRRDVSEDAVDHALGLGLAEKVGVVARQLDVLVWHMLDPLEGAGADAVLSPVRRLLHLRGLHAAQDVPGQHRDRDLLQLDPQRPRPDQLDLHGVGVDLGDAGQAGGLAFAQFLVARHVNQLGRVERSHCGVRIGVEREHHVVGREGLAVVPLHTLAQLEYPGLAVVGRTPRFGQQGLDAVARPKFTWARPCSTVSSRRRPQVVHKRAGDAAGAEGLRESCRPGRSAPTHWPERRVTWPAPGRWPRRERTCE